MKTRNFALSSLISVSSSLLLCLSPAAQAATTADLSNSVNSQLEQNGFSANDLSQLSLPMRQQLIAGSSGNKLVKFSFETVSFTKQADGSYVMAPASAISSTTISPTPNNSSTTWGSNPTLTIGVGIYDQGIAGALHYYEEQGYFSWNGYPTGNPQGSDEYTVGYGGGFGYNTNSLSSGSVTYFNNGTTATTYPAVINQAVNAGVEWQVQYPNYNTHSGPGITSFQGDGSLIFGIPTNASGICDYQMDYSFNYLSFQPSFTVGPGAYGVGLTPYVGNDIIPSTSSFTY